MPAILVVVVPTIVRISLLIFIGWGNNAPPYSLAMTQQDEDGLPDAHVIAHHTSQHSHVILKIIHSASRFQSSGLACFLQ
jgi:hypothetical protein